MRDKRDILEIVKKLEGLHTVESVARTLKIGKKTAINYISQLRKKGYVEYYQAGRKKRIYRIGSIKSNLKGEEGLYEIINKYSKIKVHEPYKHFIHGKKLSVEEALVLAVSSGNFRLILASLNLFRYVKNWKVLNRIAKKYKVQRQIGALYNVARLFIKVRRMDKRIKKSMLNGKGSEYVYDTLKSKNFIVISKEWRVEIPFNRKDLLRLKTG